MSSMFFFYLVLLPSLFVYFLYVLAMAKGWEKQYPQNRSFGIQIVPKFSIIVPYRNEIGNIESCIRQLIRQKTNYPYEIIAVDDNSEDGSRNVVDKIKKENPDIQSLYLSNASGKKTAIHHAIGKSTGEIIVTIDADIRVGENWLNTLGDFQVKYAPAMTVMPVMLDGESESMFQQMQVVEFIGLMGMTGGSILQNQAIMCNGANLAFQKSKYVDVQGYAGSEQIASGDDMFLMLKLKQSDPGSIMYLRHETVIGWTIVFNSLSDFFKQRVRWASKTPHLKDNHIVFAGVVVIMVNFLLVLLFFFVVFGISSLSTWLLFMAIKGLADYTLYKLVRPFFGKKENLPAFVLSTLVLPFYSLFIPIASIFYKPSWKGRQNRSSRPVSSHRYAKS